MTIKKINIYNKNYYFTILILSVMYFIFGKLSLFLLYKNDIVTIGIFAAEGISLAFVLYYGKKIWPGIFIGQFLLAISNNVSLESSIMVSGINSLEAVIAYIIFNKYKLDLELKAFRDIFGLLFLIFFIQIISSVPSNIVLVIFSDINSSDFFKSIFSWWFGNVMGQLLVTPFLLLLFHNYKKINFYKYISYALVFAIFIFLLEAVLMIQNTLLLLSLSVPIVIFILSKHGFVYGVLLSLVVALVSSYVVYLGIGPFNLNDTRTNIINYNLFVLAHISIVLVSGVLFEEAKRFEISLQSTIDYEIKKNQEQQLFMLQQSRLAQMGEIISMIGHQWRQPLNNLSLINQLLLSKYDQNDLSSHDVEYFKKNSKKQIDLMSNTIDDFRDFFKIQKVKMEFSINELMDNILNISRPIFTKNNIKVEFNYVDEYKVISYSNMFFQAILNILNNAKDVLIEKDVKDKKIKISLKKENEALVLSIQDNAGGIDDEIIDKIFDPYFSTKLEKNGTGLGLYMSKVIIEEQMFSQLKVVNDSEGANFQIYIKDLGE